MIITASNAVFARRIVRPRIRAWNYCRFHVFVASATKRSRNETSADHNINYKAQFCYNGFSLRQIRTQSDSNHAHRGDEEYHASRALRFLQENQPNVVVHVENVQLAAIKLLPRIADTIVQSTPVRIKVLTHVDMISDAALQQQIQTVQQMDDRIRLPNQQPLAIFALNLQSLELTMRELSEVRDALFGASLLVSRPQIVVCGAPNSGKSSFIYPLTRHRTVMEKKKGAYHLPRVSSKAGMTLGVKKHWLPPAFGSRIKHNIALLDMPGFRPKLLFADPNLVSFLLSAGVTEPFQGYQDIVSHEAMVKLLLKAVNRHATMTDPNSVPEYVELLNLTKATEDADLFLRSYYKWAKTLPNDVLDQVAGHSKDLKSIYWPRLFKSGIFGGLIFTPYPTLPQPSRSSHIVINRDSPVVYMNEQARRLMNIGRGKEEASKVTERNKMNPKSLNSSNVESDPDLRLVPVIYAPHQRSFKCMQCAEFIKVDRDGSVFGRRHGRVVDWAFNDMLSYFSRMSEAFGGIFSKRTRYLFKDSLACTLAIKHKLRSRAAAYKKFKGLKDYPIPNHLRPKRFQIDQPIPFVHSCTRKIASCRAMTKQEISKETKRLARMNASDHTIALQRARGIPIRRPRQDRPKKLVLRPDGTPVARPSYFQEECIATTVGALSAVPRYDIIKDSSIRRHDSMHYMQTNNKPSTMASISNNEPHQGESNFNRHDDASLTDSIQQLLDLCATNDVNVPEDLKQRIFESLKHGKVDVDAADLSRSTIGNHTDFIVHQQHHRRSSIEQNDVVAGLRNLLIQVKAKPPPFTLRIKNGSYKVTNMVDPMDAVQDNPSGRAKQKIKTIKTESVLYKFRNFVERCMKGRSMRTQKVEVTIMDQVNVAFQPGKMYLVLGAPGCGKSTLLKMIANTLHKGPNHVFDGTMHMALVHPTDPGINWSNLVAYIDQIDRLHPYLTVQETTEFAWRCRTGGTHWKPYYGEGPEIDNLIKDLDAQMMGVHKILDVLGLTRVKDTFVGDQKTVRGVSGGEKKRVTVAEMLITSTPILCCDEISTGLDAATTFDITRVLAAATRVAETIKIVSLLQPPPETVANFDELIVLAEGKIIYFGPVEDVVGYFQGLGYKIPVRMDVADWLQALPTEDGWIYLNEVDVDSPNVKDRHLTPEQFRERFHESDIGKALMDVVNGPIDGTARDVIQTMAKTKYFNTAYKSLQLVVRRELLLWWRDKPAIKAKVMQTTVMGIVVGTLFFQNESPQDLMGVLFQSVFFCSLSAMLLVVAQFPARSIFYKHQDARFFPTWSYVLARSIAAIPVGLIDALYFGSYIYFLVGLALNQGDASVANYFLFLLIMFISAWTSGLFFSIYSSCVQTITSAQAMLAVTLILMLLFCGFTVQPDVIPVYYIWVYWINYFSWLFRAVVVNEFDSGRYNELITLSTGEVVTVGESILIRFGFVDGNDVPYTFEWVFWAVLFSIGAAVAACCASIFFLSNIRFATGQTLVTDSGSSESKSAEETQEEVLIPFKKVDLTFKDIHYTVKASTSDEKLELLKGIDGVVQAGKMTALMGSSGAGKTTLMDVIAMRKASGEISGEICLNGHPQEEKSFRRCMGYVEQFDSQTPELTIRETCDFSAKLRLDEGDPAVTPESTAKFVDQILAMLELTNIQDLQVGSDETGGLSFEQRKRLSIAVELVANVSIIFADEPTSGLDASAAAIVMRGLKRIAQSGRAVCCTIHQPSIAIFNDFDELLLLKRGGETVFFGELGKESSLLIEYLESFDATHKIHPGENPATWMLTTIGAGSASSNSPPFDYAGSYARSALRQRCIERIDKICSDATEDKKIAFASEYATSYGTQSSAVFSRTTTVYYRSPSYNVTRVVVAVVVSLLFGSVFVSQRVPMDEGDMNSRINSIFMSVLFINAKMYGTGAIVRAFTFAEIPFILMSSTAFTLIFYFFLGFAKEADKFFLFYLFVTLGLGSFTMIGQMLVALFRDSQTAQGFGGLFISMTSLFSGILIRPNNIPSFWIFLYYMTPGHYIFEGLFVSQFDGDQTQIEASPGSPFYVFLGCSDPTKKCTGLASDWVQSSFPDFSTDNIKWSIIYLIALLITSRIVTFVALTHLDYRAT